MEGDFASGCILLPEYLCITKALEEMQSTCESSTLAKMIDAMLRHNCKNQAEATRCEAVLIATVLNPRYRLRFLELHYPDQANLAHTALSRVFQDKLDSCPITPPPSPKLAPTSTPQETDDYDIFGASSSPSGADSP